MTEARRIIRLDPSSLETYSECPRKFQLVNRRGYMPKMGSSPLDFGNAIHKAIACWRKARASLEESEQVTLDPEPFIEVGIEYYAAKLCVKEQHRSMENLRAVLEGYFKWYRVDPFTPLRLANNDIAVELWYQRKIYSNEHTDVLLCGVIDSIGFYDGDVLSFLDIKHSSALSPEKHLEEQQARPQFHIYAWVLQQEGIVQHYLPVIIDGIYISKKFKGAKFLRPGPYVIPDYLIERTMARVHRLAKWLAETPDEESFEYNYSACHGKYSLCPFYHVCQLEERDQEMPLSMAFRQREYNPAKFGEEGN